MSSGAALSTPREHLIKITSALTATGQMAAQARAGIASNSAGRRQAYPLGSLLIYADPYGPLIRVMD